MIKKLFLSIINKTYSCYLKLFNPEKLDYILDQKKKVEENSIIKWGETLVKKGMAQKYYNENKGRWDYRLYLKSKGEQEEADKLFWLIFKAETEKSLNDPKYQ